MKIKKNLILIVLLWWGLIALSFSWNYTNAKNELERIAFYSSRNFFDHIVITRRWNALHGGLYAPVTKNMPPNPFLDVPMREIKVNEQLTLTKINPAYMTRQISEIAKEQDGLQFHITSLNPIRPQNKATRTEEEVLKEFATGLKEKGFFVTEGGQNYYFYMAPLITEKTCLKCHAKQGYKEGDIRGGISIRTPFLMKIPFLPLLLGHLTIGLVGFFGLALIGQRLNKAYETIKKHAVLDALTGVPNRRSFSESILKEYKRSQRAQQPLGVIMCDVDNFKIYNDTYGHHRGDLCLKKVAQTVKKSLQRPEDFCARYGGEEFVVLLPNTSLHGTMVVAERIRSNIEKTGIQHEKSLPAQVVTVSLGVTTSRGPSSVSSDDLVNNADMALYKAKEQGRNQVQSFIETA